MTPATVIGGAIGAVVVLALAALFWRLVSWSRSDSKAAGRWEIDFNHVAAERDAFESALKGEKDDHARTKAQLSDLNERYAALAATAISSANDRDATRLAGGDGPGLGDGLLTPDFGDGGGTAGTSRLP